MSTGAFGLMNDMFQNMKLRKLQGEGISGKLF